MPRLRTGARAAFFRFTPQLCLRKCIASAGLIMRPIFMTGRAQIAVMAMVIGAFNILPAHAVPSCGLEKWLANLNAAANSYVTALGTPNQVATERILRRQMERHSRDQLIRQINEAELGTNKIALESFIVARRHLYDLSRHNWHQMAVRFGNDPRFASQSQAMNAFLRATECDPYAENFLNDTTAERSVLERVQTAVSILAEPPAASIEIDTEPSHFIFDSDNFDDFKAPRYQPKTETIVIPLSPSQNAPVYLGLFTFFVSVSIWIWMRIGIAQRRAVRYPCSVPIVVFDGSVSILSELHDLSQLGAKLESDLTVKPKSQLHVTINKTMRPAVVTWTDQNFIGIKFDNALSEMEMTDILGGFAKRVAASQDITGGFESLVDDVYGTSATTLSDHLARSGADKSAQQHLTENSEIDAITIKNVYASQERPEKDPQEKDT